MSHHEPTTPKPVPDDRVHGDSLHGDGPYGDPWLRPTLATQRAETPAEAEAEAEAVGTGPARPQPPSVRRSWLVAGLGATLLLSSGFGVLSWDSLTGGLWRSVDQQQTYAQPTGVLTIKGGANDVEVLGGGEPGKIRVSRQLSWGPASTEPTAGEELVGSTLTLDADCNGFLGWCSVDYVVTVPDASEVAVDNGSGDITITGSFGGVSLTVGSGDIESANLRAEDVRAVAGSGDIDLELGTAASPVEVRTGSGDVTVEIPPDATYAVQAAASSGDADVSVATDPRSTSTMRINTGSGDIAIDYR
jgi:hypothetical protein